MMTRSQAVIIAILLGFVVLACIGMIVLLTLPYERLFPPTPTSPPPPPTITATPTTPNFLPTANLITPSVEPTATNTRVATVTPRSPQPPTPTVVIELPTPFIRPTATPIPIPTSLPTPTPVPTKPTPTFIPRQYSISFEAEETTITKGECTDLKWKVQGASMVRLDGKDVNPSGKKEVCPKKDTDYQLTIQLPGSAGLEHRTVEISVVEEEEK